VISTHILPPTLLVVAPTLVRRRARCALRVVLHTSPFDEIRSFRIVDGEVTLGPVRALGAERGRRRRSPDSVTTYMFGQTQNNVDYECPAEQYPAAFFVVASNFFPRFRPFKSPPTMAIEVRTDHPAQLHRRRESRRTDRARKHARTISHRS